jgi:hypothetical protein
LFPYKLILHHMESNGRVETLCRPDGLDDNLSELCRRLELATPSFNSSVHEKAPVVDTLAKSTHPCFLHTSHSPRQPRTRPGESVDPRCVDEPAPSSVTDALRYPARACAFRRRGGACARDISRASCSRKLPVTAGQSHTGVRSDDSARRWSELNGDAVPKPMHSLKYS